MLCDQVKQLMQDKFPAWSDVLQLLLERLETGKEFTSLDLFKALPGSNYAGVVDLLSALREKNLIYQWLNVWVTDQEVGELLQKCRTYEEIRITKPVCTIEILSSYQFISEV